MILYCCRVVAFEQQLRHKLRLLLRAGLARHGCRCGCRHSLPECRLRHRRGNAPFEATSRRSRRVLQGFRPLPRLRVPDVNDGWWPAGWTAGVPRPVHDDRRIPVSGRRQLRLSRHDGLR